MEELRSSGAALSRKVPNGSSATSAAASSAYDDVFGGPTRYSGPFAARLSDFSEIFGGLASACSIPVLDLPPAIDGYEVPADARSSGFDYSEIFGGFDGGGFGVSYEELVAEREGAEAESKVQEALASNGRAPKDTTCGQQVTGVSETSPNDTNNESMACLEKDQISSDSTHLHGGAKQFHTSYHKTSRGNIEDVISELTHITQLHAVPGFTFDVETRPPLLHIRSGNPPNMVTGDLSLNAGLKGGINDTKQGKIFSPSSSAANTKSSGNDLKMDHNQFVTECPASEDDPSNLKHHSRSSSNYSTSSGDVYYPDVTYLTVSDISLRTQPLRIPPPSRPPPKVANNQGNPKMTIYGNFRVDLGEGSFSKPAVDHHKHGGWGAPKRHAPQVAVNDNFCFFDVEVDARSAAAASAAAMKEAMEQAEARLKSAKESMERKRDSLSRKKLGQHEGTKHKEGKEDKVPQETGLFSEVVTEKNLVKEDEMKNECVLEERQEVREAAKVAPDREEKESDVVSDQHRQMMRGNEVKSSHTYKLNEGHGEWKTDTQFYELVNNEKKFRVIREVSDEECAEKKPKATTRVNIEKENARKEAQLTYEFERNGNLWEVNETSENEENSRKSRDRNMTGMQEEIKELSNTIPGEKKPKATTKVNIEKGHVRKEAQLTYEFESNGNLWGVNETPEKEENSRKSRACNMTGMEEKIKELSNKIPVTCVQEQMIGKTEVIYDFHQPEKNGKVGEAQEVHIIVEEARKINDEDARACGESEKKLESSYEDCKLEGVRESEDKESKLEAAKVFCGCEDGEELSRSFATCQPHESEKKLKLANKTGLQDGSEKEAEVTRGSCIWEASEKVEAAQVPTQCENSDGEATLECCYEEDENKLKETSLAPEQEGGEIISRTEEACILVENELKHKVAQEDNELVVNFEKLKASGTIGLRENEKIVVVEEARRQAYNKMKTREAKFQGQQNDKNQNAGQMPSELENNEELIVAELDRGKKEDGYIKEVHVAIDLKENHKMFNAARDVFQMAVKRDFKDVQEARLLEKKVNILSSAQDNSNCRTVVTENITDRRRREERENQRRVERERKQEQENTRKLEEKEREREREKDRLAVERATREARERAYAEARERAERIAVERVTAEARQRALAESREKAERASAEALEKSLAEKASREARLRAERAAVERATAEARERAVEKALAEKAAADARERTEKLNGSSWERMRKDNGTEAHFRDRDKGDGGTRDMQDFPHSAQFQSAGSSNSGQRHSDSYNHVSYSNEKFEVGDGESALRCKARLERHQRTVDRAANALAEKNLRDKLAQREQAERNRLAETLDADVRRWSNGKEGNLRALLSTLQYILGSESGWQPIPLTDVITAAAVKKAYRKATLCVHPDKLQQRGASIQQKYICEKVFDLLKEAWNRFNSEER